MKKMHKVFIILIVMIMSNCCFARVDLSLINKERKNDSMAWNYYGQNLTSKFKSRFVNFSHSIESEGDNLQLLLICDTTSNRMALDLVTNSGKLISVNRLELRDSSSNVSWNSINIKDGIVFSTLFAFFKANEGRLSFRVFTDSNQYETNHFGGVGDFDMHSKNCMNKVFSAFSH